MGFSTKMGFKIRDPRISWYPFGTKNYEMRGPPVLASEPDDMLKIVSIGRKIWHVFDLLVVHRTREAIQNFLIYSLWVIFRPQTRYKNWVAPHLDDGPAKILEISCAWGLRPISFLNISISCQHGLLCWMVRIPKYLFTKKFSFSLL